MQNGMDELFSRKRDDRQIRFGVFGRGWNLEVHLEDRGMREVSGSLGEETDAELLDILHIVQGQRNVMKMVQMYESHKMTPDQEVRFFQLILDAGVVWAMPSKYMKRAKEMIEKKNIYLN